MIPAMVNNENMAAEAFSQQSGIFDELYGCDTIIRYKRDRVRSHMEQYLSPGSRILELNAGTGEDTLYFATKGHSVHATDISQGMLGVLRAKAERANQHKQISYEQIDFTTLTELHDKGPYDHIFSNFAGLNCTQQLDKVLQSLSPLLKENGVVTLVILPKYCLWESLLLLKGKFRTAFRRFGGSKGTKARVEGVHFTCWYYNPSVVISQLGDGFKLLGIEGLCTLVPPSYFEGFAEKYPALYRRLVKWEDRYKHSWPWRSIGDYYIISLQKRSIH